jgi:predicted SnoaL-like aldol condensation-catalyzing enzyme
MASRAERKRTMERVIDDIIGKGHLDAVDELYTPDFLWHAPSIELKGRGQLKGLFDNFRKAFPGRTYSYELMLFTGDYVIGRWVLEGKQDGPIMGVKPTGKKIRTTGITIHRFEGNQIAEEWEEFDGLGMLRQLGALPTKLGL